MHYELCVFSSCLFYQFSNMLADKEHPGRRLNHRDYFIAGSMTGCVASLAESPIDLVSGDRIRSYLYNITQVKIYSAL